MGKRLFGIVAVSSLVALSGISTIVGTVSWFVQKASVDAGDNISGSTKGAYFGGGDGKTKDTAYLIQNKYHVYNLAWLTYLENDSKVNFFKGKQAYFKVSNDINMEGMTIPPIGTTTSPFIGFFDGNGKVIYNFNVANSLGGGGIIKKPGRVTSLQDLEILGFFGVVGKIATEDVSYETAVPYIKNLGLFNFTISNTSNVSGNVMGLAAGYVNGDMSGVSVGNSNLNIKQNTVVLDKVLEGTTGKPNYVSNYGLVGYCTKPFLEKTNVVEKDTDIPVVTKGAAQSGGNTYGASIPMKDIFEDVYGRLSNSADAKNYTYPTAQSEYYDQDNNLINTVDTSTGTTQESFYYYDGYNRRQTSYVTHAEVTKDGYTIASYNFGNPNGINTSRTYNSYMYMGGEYQIRNYTQTVKVYQESDAYYIFNGNNYLASSGTSSVINVNSKTNATKWIYKNNRLFIVDDTTHYYLYTNENGTTLSLGTNPSARYLWTYDEETKLFKNNTNNYYLVFDTDASVWTTVPAINNTAYYIYDNGHYLTIDETNISTTTNKNSAIRWIYKDSKVYTLINNVAYYLTTNNSGVVSLSTNSTNYNSWTLDNGCFKNNQTNGFLLYHEDSNTWYCTATLTYSAYYIHDGSNYLVNNGTTGVRSGAQTGATPWVYEGGRLFMLYGGQKYYLNDTGSNGTLNLVATTSTNNSWTIDAESGLFKNSGTNRFLVYDEGLWVTVSQLTYNTFYIHDGDNYLSADGTAVINVVGSSNATRWFKDGNNFYIKDNGTTYYLTCNNSSVSLNTTKGNYTAWTLSNGLYYNSSRNRFLVFNGSNWTASSSSTTSFNAYPIYIRVTSGSGWWSYYLVYNQGNFSVTQTRKSGTDFVSQNYEDGKVFFLVIDNIKYYLGVDNSNLTITNDISKAFILSDGYLYNGDDYIGLDSNYNWVVVTESYASSGVAQSGSSRSTVSFPYSCETTTGPNYTYGEDTEKTSTSFDLVKSSTEETAINYSGDNEKDKDYDYITTRSDQEVLKTRPTFIPLKFNDAKTDISAENTGYIVSGSHSAASSNATDIRISQYKLYMDYSSGEVYHLGKTFGDNSTEYTENTSKHFEILTRTKNTDDYVRISDEYNQNNKGASAVVSTEFSTISKYNVADLGLTKYTQARKSFHATMLESGENVYGLHFMNSQINKNNVVTPDRVMVNGWEYYGNKAYEHAPLIVDGKIVRDDDGNIVREIIDHGDVGGKYELPEDCIDFNLSENGTINFFAGTYFADNSSFFSLHQIFRDTNDSDGDGSVVDIKEIKEIRKVYNNTDYDVFENPSAPRYVYEYKDDSGTTSYSSGTRGEMLFDMAWITDIGSAIIMYAAYYFEIPAMPGEYALGSVKNSNGAYLLYLDIGAAEQTNDIMYVEEVIRTSTTAYAHPKGIDFAVLVSGTTPVYVETNGSESATVIIPANTSGNITFTVAESQLTCGPPSSGSITQSTYIADGYSALCNSSELTVIGGVNTTMKETKTTKYSFDQDNDRLLTEITNYKTFSNGDPITETESIITRISSEDYEKIKVVANDQPYSVKDLEFYYCSSNSANVTVKAYYEYNATTMRYTYVFEIISDAEIKVVFTKGSVASNIAIRRVNEQGTAMEDIAVTVNTPYTIYKGTKPEANPEP